MEKCNEIIRKYDGSGFTCDLEKNHTGKHDLTY